jgi:hypothetical protein
MQEDTVVLEKLGELNYVAQIAAEPRSVINKYTIEGTWLSLCRFL